MALATRSGTGRSSGTKDGLVEEHDRGGVEVSGALADGRGCIAALRRLLAARVQPSPRKMEARAGYRRPGGKRVTLGATDGRRLGQEAVSGVGAAAVAME